MSLKLILPVSALVLSVVACGSKDEKSSDAPQVRTEIPLNGPTDIVGTWLSCAKIEGTGNSTGGFYSFLAEGGLFFRSVLYKNDSCQGAGTDQFTLDGTYVVGADNSLDMTLGKKKGQSTVYRVYSVQKGRLLISNNIGYGADASRRDVDLSTEVLTLTKFEI